jgi:hypothetical protein
MLLAVFQAVASVEAFVGVTGSAGRDNAMGKLAGKR